MEPLIESRSSFKGGRTPILSLLISCALAASCSGGGEENSSGDPGDPGAPGAPGTPGITNGAYLASDGLVAVEFESGTASGDWVSETTLSGFTGSSYLRWSGANMYSTPGVDTFGFDFWIEDPGTYQFRIHNRHEDPDSTLANDLWVRVDGDAWVKAFSWQRGQWTWVTQHEFSHSNKPDAQYTLTSGNHRIEFSGRSFDFCCDRFHLYDTGVVDPLNTNHPISQRNGTGSLTAPGTGELPSEDSLTTLVTLDSHLSRDAVEAGETVTWTIPRAMFVDGTSAEDPIAVAMIPGGSATPIELAVSGLDGVRTTTSVLQVDGRLADVGGDLRVGGKGSLTFDDDLGVELVTLQAPSGAIQTVEVALENSRSTAWVLLSEAGPWAFYVSDRDGVAGRFEVLDAREPSPLPAK